MLPFNTERNLMLRWNDWSARLFSETADDDETVAEDSAEIARILGNRGPAWIADCTHRVRVLFHDDPQEQHIDDMGLDCRSRRRRWPADDHSSAL